MTSGIRWRIFVLQIGLIGILGFVSGFAFWAGNFASGQVTTQLSEQQITFPASNSPAITALPAADAAAMSVYAGQTMTTGAQAETYADHFIAVHLQEIGGGKTYAQFPATGLTPAQATQKAELFQGETLRGLLLNAYGWSQVGTFATYAGVGLAVAAFAVMLAFLFEVAMWRRSTTKVVSVDLQKAGGYQTHVTAA
ncbi:MAG: hypothetical protein JOY80_09460 [Candidatus Dormibacteraeota bacterium]|nr:hypothetical protein [Candidatus Dormibacteraeota bacterium]